MKPRLRKKRISSATPLKKLNCDSTSGNISCGLPTVSESKNRRVCGDGSADFETDTVSGDLIITSAE